MKLFNKLAFVALTAFALNACEDVPAPYTLPGDNTDENPTPEGVYINESFTNSFGSFSTTETEGNYPWVIDYGTAKATSYIDNANNAAQSWLISQPINLTNETAAYIKFDYIIRYAVGEGGLIGSFTYKLIRRYTFETCYTKIFFNISCQLNLSLVVSGVIDKIKSCAYGSTWKLNRHTVVGVGFVG